MFQHCKTNSKLKYWKKKQDHMLKFLEENFVPMPQRNAIQNTIGVFMSMTGHHEVIQAKEYFAELCKNKQDRKINTISNYRSVCNMVEGGQQELETCPDSDLEKAIALCERGYFQLYKYDEQIQTREQAEIAAKFLEAGIVEATSQGMSQGDLCVWNYYLCDATRKAFDFTFVKNDNIDTQMEAFHRMVMCFQNFYSLATSEEYTFYKSRAVVDIILTLTIHEAAIDDLPNFTSLFDNDFLGDFWGKKYDKIQQALKQSSNDYRVLARVARIYSRQDKYEDALKYAQISLKVRSYDCCSAKHTQMIAYSQLGKAAAFNGEYSRNIEYLLLAYSEGKKLNNKIMSASCAAEMGKVCLQLSLDQAARPRITLREGGAQYLEEAIDYNKKAIDMFPEQRRPRAYRLLSDCYWVQNRYNESFQCLRKSIEVNLPKRYVVNFRYLLNRYKTLLISNKIINQLKEDIVIQVAEDLLKAWTNLHQTPFQEKLYDIFIYFISTLNDPHRFPKNILQQLVEKDVTDDKEVLRGYCRWLQQSGETREWFRDIGAVIQVQTDVN